MTQIQKVYEEIADSLVNEQKGTAYGKMMSSPAILYKKKVFTFYYNNSMVFKFGKDFDIISTGVMQYELLNPFRNKPAMAGWYVIGHNDADKWQDLAELAYQKIKKESDEKDGK